MCSGCLDTGCPYSIWLTDDNFSSFVCMCDEHGSTLFSFCAFTASDSLIAISRFCFQQDIEEADEKIQVSLTGIRPMLNGNKTLLCRHY